MFTQFDMLTARVQWSDGEATGSDEIKKQVAEIFERETVAPFKQLTRKIPGDIPFVPVSGMSPSLGSGVPFC